MFFFVQIFWKLECGEIFNGTDSGEFTSPGYPVAYRNNLRCEYQIITTPQDFVEIEFIEPFSFERECCILLFSRID
jgi:hypothetical protein